MQVSALCWALASSSGEDPGHPGNMLDTGPSPGWDTPRGGRLRGHCSSQPEYLKGSRPRVRVLGRESQEVAGPEQA